MGVVTFKVTAFLNCHALLGDIMFVVGDPYISRFSNKLGAHTLIGPIYCSVVQQTLGLKL